MDLEKHRKPNGNYDGPGLMAEVTGLSRADYVELAAQVHANHAKLEACPWHEFSIVTECLGKPLGSSRYRCKHCEGEVDFHAYRWHQKGRRPMPVPMPVMNDGKTAFRCVGGPRDGEWITCADGVTSFVVQVMDREPFPKVEYRLQASPGDLCLLWVCQGEVRP